MEKFVDPDRALELVLEHTSTLEPKPVRSIDAEGLVLAKDIIADRDYPPFDRAMMDGFVVCKEDLGKESSIAGEIAAGETSDTGPTIGNCFRIMTGAPCPAGSYAVIERELTEETDDKVKLPADIPEDRNIARKGCESQKGNVVAKKGTVITPLVEAVAATVGKTEEILANQFPDLEILTTGNELISTDNCPGSAQIRNSNGNMLVAFTSNSCPTFSGIKKGDFQYSQVLDTEESLSSSLNKASKKDIIILTGGVSAGKYDLVPQALTDYGAELIFHKVTQKPGKPFLFANKGKQLIFALPGNPLAVHLGFHRYVLPAIRKMSGRNPHHAQHSGRLTSDLSTNDKRTVFMFATVEESIDGCKISPLPSKGSADIFSPVGGNAYIRLEPGENHLKAGDTIPFEWIGEHR